MHSHLTQRATTRSFGVAVDNLETPRKKKQNFDHTMFFFAVMFLLGLILLAKLRSSASNRVSSTGPDASESQDKISHLGGASEGMPGLEISVVEDIEEDSKFHQDEEQIKEEPDDEPLNNSQEVVTREEEEKKLHPGEIIARIAALSIHKDRLIRKQQMAQRITADDEVNITSAAAATAGEKDAEDSPEEVSEPEMRGRDSKTTEASRHSEAGRVDSKGVGGAGDRKGSSGGDSKGAKAAVSATPAVGRIAGFGSGISKTFKVISERQAAELLGGFIGAGPVGLPLTASVSQGGTQQVSFHPRRSFVMNAARWPEGQELPFPRKKLRNKLTHYSLGKVTKKLRAVLPPTDPLRAAMAVGTGGLANHKKWGRCAVIGNGGSLSLYELGSLIDEHNIVIRMNGGITLGFANKVGSRTNYRLVNRAHMGFSESDKEHVLQHVSTPDALAQFISVAAKAKLHANSAKMFAIDPDFHEFAMYYMDKGVLSNGFYSTVLATELCEKVTIFGFLRNWKGVTRYHYYNEVEPDGQQSLRDQKEADRLEWFIGNHSSTHSYGEPCMTTLVDSGMAQACTGCGAGAECQKGLWHPVPKPGYCYERHHPAGNGVPNVGCFHKCDDLLSLSDCPGGVNGFCPNDANSYSTACAS